MNELKRIVSDMETVFAESSYPPEFLADYDQMECLSIHNGRETFLVQRKDSGEAAIASCYDRSRFPCSPDIMFLRSLNHPGIPHYYREYRNAKMLCIVREYIEGETLSVYSRERQLTVSGIISIGIQLCGILEVLHKHDPPIIHRDIKPENIIVKPDGQIVLIDFDISRVVKENADTDTVFFGTRGYAPPEQYGFGQTDSRTDIYAFGVLLRYLITGSERANTNIKINSRLQRIIDRCTAFSPIDRYHDIGEVKRDLEAANRPREPLKPRTIILSLILAALFTAAGFAVGRFTDLFRKVPKVVFSEPLIEKAVRMQLGKERGELSPEELSSVKEIYIYGTEAFSDRDLFYQCSIDNSNQGLIRTLDDLAYLPGLEELHIIYQGYMDISGVAGLPNLITVELKHMRISGIAPIADVPRLKHAILFCSGLYDVTPLENCPWLETLDIGLNDITDLAQIGSYPRVQSLGLMWLEMDNLDGIADRFPKVKAVMLQHGEIGDLTGLRELPELEAVYVLAEQEERVREVLRDTDVVVNVTAN